MKPDDFTDFYRLDDLLDDGERRIRDRVRSFVDRECLPVIARHFDRGTFPLDLVPRMAEMGLFGAHVTGYGVACGAAGSAAACFEAARSFALERKVFNQAIASYQMIQGQLADMLADLTKSDLINRRLGRLMDEGQARPAQISLAKRENIRAAMRTARTAREILGARGILADYHVIRHLCDLEAVSALEGTDHMHGLVLGQAITGIGAFH